MFYDDGLLRALPLPIKLLVTIGLIWMIYEAIRYLMWLWRQT